MIGKNLEVYRQEAQDFYHANYWRSDEENLVNRYFAPAQGKKLLVLGCGAGRTLLPLYKKGFEITAIDIVPEMVEAARKKVGDRPIKILLMDATDLKFADNSFDYVFFPFHGLDCVDQRYQGISEAKRVLKPGGVFIFNSHNLFFPRSIKRFFKNPRRGRVIKIGQGANALWLYHTTFLEVFKLRRYFSSVKFYFRRRQQSLPFWQSNWKDKLLKIFPIIDKSIYFVCRK